MHNKMLDCDHIFFLEKISAFYYDEIIFSIYNLVCKMFIKI